ncbi:MAG: EI24 domain-containing protein [Planctomycetes bacterium]|nr:EI24 domain-containing protein [Planctomycetota bacterium]MCB9936386.1 EI24 domain-containing protein [Planctomycetota bacterium]
MNEAKPLPITTPLPGGLKGFVSGFSAFAVGLKLVFPGGGLFRYALAPIVLSVFVLTGVAAGAFFAAKYWLVEWLQQGWAGWLGGVLAFLLTLVIAYFLFVPVMTVFAPLFIDPICEKVHQRYTGADLIGERSAQQFIKRQLFALVQSLKWTLVVLLIQLPLAIGALLTGVLAFVAIPVGAIIMGADLMDYPLALKHYTVSRKLGWSKRHFWPAVGMGSAASLLLLVPGLNLFVAPAGAAAATLLMMATGGGSPESSEHP